MNRARKNLPLTLTGLLLLLLLALSFALPTEVQAEAAPTCQSTCVEGLIVDIEICKRDPQCIRIAIKVMNECIACCRTAGTGCSTF